MPESDGPADRDDDGDAEGEAVCDTDAEALGVHDGGVASPSARHCAQGGHAVGADAFAGQWVPTGQIATVPFGEPTGQK